MFKGWARAIGFTSIMLVLTVSGCLGGGEPADGGDDVKPAEPGAFDEETGAIEGRVIDDEGLPVPGAQVGLRLADDERTTATDAAGAFSFSQVPPGTHQLFVQALGFESFARNVNVVVGTAQAVDVLLKPIAVAEPYPESLNHNGVIDTQVAYVRSVLPLNLGGMGDSWFLFGGFPQDFAGMKVEAQWDTTDFLAFDLLSRSDEHGAVWHRTRAQSPLDYLALPCADYTGDPYYGRQAMPCTPEEFEDLEGDNGDAAHLETFYAGQYQDEAHLADPVCQTGTPYWPAYEAGCYGVGVAPELRWTTWVTIFHLELPPDAEQFSAFPDA